MNTKQNRIGSTPQSGMRDFTPQEVQLRDWATAVIARTYEQFGFTRIETPCLENLALLRRGDGGENLQLIFEVLKRGDKLEKVLAEALESNVQPQKLADMGLRFDLTVPLVRFYANNQASLPNPFRALQIGSVWRAERPQQGRFRQFTQCDIDILGVKSEFAEIELLSASAQALTALGFEGFTIYVNDRRLLADIVKYCGFEEEAFAGVFIALDKLDKIGLEGVCKELSAQGQPMAAIAELGSLLLEFAGQEKDLLAFVCAKVQADTEIQSGLRNILDVVSAQSQGRFAVKLDPSLVRGMGYYTGPIFEIKYPGYSYSIAGGGRYDKMVGKLSGRDVPACGFSLGFERIVGILQEKQICPAPNYEKLALIYDSGRDCLSMVMAAATRLRQDGWAVVMQQRKKDLKKQIDLLPAQGINKLCLFRGAIEQLEIANVQFSSSNND